MLRPKHVADAGALPFLHRVKLCLLRRVQQHGIGGHVRIVQNSLNQLWIAKLPIFYLCGSGNLNVLRLLHARAVLREMEECSHTSWRICLIFGERGRGMKWLRCVTIYRHDMRLRVQTSRSPTADGVDREALICSDNHSIESKVEGNDIEDNLIEDGMLFVHSLLAAVLVFHQRSIHFVVLVDRILGDPLVIFRSPPVVVDKVLARSVFLFVDRQDLSWRELLVSTFAK